VLHEAAHVIAIEDTLTGIPFMVPCVHSIHNGLAQYPHIIIVFLICRIHLRQERRCPSIRALIAFLTGKSLALGLVQAEISGLHQGQSCWKWQKCEAYDERDPGESQDSALAVEIIWQQVCLEEVVVSILVSKVLVARIVD
jgi:hypothetical protein